MQSYRIDGNNILEVYTTIEKIAKKIRKNPEPVLVECVTFRRRGHEEASGTKYVPDELMKHWEAKDPIANYEQFLLDKDYITQADIDKRKKDIKTYIKQELDIAYDADEVEVVQETEVREVYAPSITEVVNPSTKVREMRFIDAISDGLNVAMAKWDNLVLMGQDIADYGGVFKITDGFVDSYGKARVRNTPLCESAIVGIGSVSYTHLTLPTICSV